MGLCLFLCLLVLSRHVCQLYTHGNIFLLILTYQASYIQILKGTAILILLMPILLTYKVLWVLVIELIGMFVNYCTFTAIIPANSDPLG